ncbi:MAG TPA: hypothetical protein VGZ91_05755 [Candidatus Sulfotelmatobacter sp.]|nr:hypothetical protein [Candidatus Sulfotelmatobacter sp.]
MSSTYFMGDFGGGIRIYPYENFFVRREMRFYLVNNNVEFSSRYSIRYGVPTGCTFGGRKQEVPYARG